ncbi:hypothetical protein AAVH_38741 [Aphelenchoides avenae]|nr:hypothetical protein AAVH_38741 [Aphelenchus avenae]
MPSTKKTGQTSQVGQEIRTAVDTSNREGQQVNYDQQEQTGGLSDRIKRSERLANKKSNNQLKQEQREKGLR